MLKTICLFLLLVQGFVSAKRSGTPQILESADSIAQETLISLSGKAIEVKKEQGLKSRYRVSFENRVFFRWPGLGGQIEMESLLERNQKLKGDFIFKSDKKVTVQFQSYAKLFHQVHLKTNVPLDHTHVYRVPLKALYNPSGQSPRILSKQDDGRFRPLSIDVITLQGDQMLIYSKEKPKKIVLTRHLFIEKI